MGYVSGDIIKKLKENGYQYTWGDVTVRLAEAYGFCWGVERAVQIVYEARKQFPTEKIWLTNEIIHNPTVNNVLFPFQSLFLEMKYKYITTHSCFNTNLALFPFPLSVWRRWKLRKSLLRTGRNNLIWLSRAMLWFCLLLGLL